MITLKPTIRYWLMRKFPNFLIISLLFMVAFFMRQADYVMYLSGTFAMVMVFNAMWSYIVLYNITYMIAIEQIIIKRGVFRRTTNYMEMYRIYDYRKRQNVVEAAFGLMNIDLFSRDMSNPLVTFIGINNSDDVIPVIRDRVETEKRRKNIVEFNNPYGLPVQ